MEPITCHIQGVYFATSDLGVAPVVLLETPNHLYLPIFIGLYEAISISNALNGPRSARPMTHDLFADTLNQLETTIREITIDTLEDGVYYATISLESASAVLSIDCRPSDGIALAVRLQSPVRVDALLLQDAAVPSDQLPELHDISAGTG